MWEGLWWPIRRCFWRKSSINWNYVIFFYTDFGEGGYIHIFFFMYIHRFLWSGLTNRDDPFCISWTIFLRLVLLKNFVNSVIVNYFFFQKLLFIYFIYVRRFLQNGLTNQDNFFCNLWGMFSHWCSYKTFLHLFFVNYIFCKNQIFIYVRLLRIEEFAFMYVRWLLCNCWIDIEMVPKQQPEWALWNFLTIGFNSCFRPRKYCSPDFFLDISPLSLRNDI